jgi:ankyrin repeat protein
MRDSFNKVAAVHFAAFKGHNTIVDFLSKKGARPTIADKRGTTALHYAAYSGHLEVVKTLLHYGADPLSR